MVQAIVYTDEKEDAVVNCYANKWSVSKAETIKKILREYDKLVKENKKNGISS